MQDETGPVESVVGLRLQGVVMYVVSGIKLQERAIRAGLRVDDGNSVGSSGNLFLVLQYDVVITRQKTDNLASHSRGDRVAHKRLLSAWW